MRRRIERYRRVPTDPRAQYSVGCIILQAPFFFAEADWLPAPADFRAQTVQGKTYDLNEPIGHKLWQTVLERWRGVRPPGVAEPSRPEIPLEWRVRPVRQRLGQGAFRVLVTDIYQRRCAITGEKALPVLQAAHIRPVTRLLLRSDLHALFDQGYVTVTPDHRVRQDDLAPGPRGKPRTPRMACQHGVSWVALLKLLGSNRLARQRDHSARLLLESHHGVLRRRSRRDLCADGAPERL
jgi:hypothetical protein